MDSLIININFKLFKFFNTISTHYYNQYCRLSHRKQQRDGMRRL